MLPAPLPRTHEAGFSLVELAVVLLIVGLLLSGLVPTISGQIEQQRINETRKELNEIHQALIGFVVAKGYLPCPAISAVNGLENRNNAGICVVRHGFIAWQTLGVSKLDAWGRIIRYSASGNYTRSNPPLFNLNSTRDITMHTRNMAGVLINLSNSNDLPAIILSHGSNGLGGILEDGTPVGGASATNVDEQANITGNMASAIAGRAYMSRDQSRNTASAAGEFDDIVVGVSPNVLMNRMVAGKADIEVTGSATTG